MSNNKGKRLAQIELDKMAEKNLKNEAVIRDSILFKEVAKNNDEIDDLSKKVSSIMEKYQIDEPVSSQDGTFVAYPKRVGMSGVDMDRVIQTGILDWFIANKLYQYLSLNLIKIRDELGMDLSGYAIRDAYTMYSVSTDEDYKYMVNVIDRYREKNNVQKA